MGYPGVARITLTRVQEYLYGYLLDHLKLAQPKKNTTIPPELLAHYVASSFIALMTWWIDNGYPCSAEKMKIRVTGMFSHAPRAENMHYKERKILRRKRGSKHRNLRVATYKSLMTSQVQAICQGRRHFTFLP